MKIVLKERLWFSGCLKPLSILVVILLSTVMLINVDGIREFTKKSDLIKYDDRVV